LTTEIISEIERLHSEGFTISEISKKIGVDYSTIKKGVGRGVIILMKPLPSHTISTISSRSRVDASELMGKACRNVVERASHGNLGCPVEFQDHVDLQYGGLLLTLPALLASGILYGISRFDLPKVYYSVTQIFLSLAFMVMLRVKQLEQSKMLSSGELGRCLGMDRTPCVQTLRNRLHDFTSVADAGKWSLELSRYWMKEDKNLDGVLYVDGHVNIYYGKSVEMPARYVSRMRLCLSGSTDYWVNGALGQPYFVVHKTANEGMIKAISNDIIPELDKSVPHQPCAEDLEKNPLLHRYMIVFDREGYSVPFFCELKKKRIAFCSYRKYVRDKWDLSEFQEYSEKDKYGEEVRIKLAERGTFLSTKKVKGKTVASIWVREVRKLNDSGHQTSIITTNHTLSITDTGFYMFARWCQENYFKYAMESFGIDYLISNVKNSILNTYTIPNKDYTSVSKKHKSISAKLSNLKIKLANTEIKIDRDELSEKRMKKHIAQKAEILDSIEIYKNESEAMKQQMKEIPKRIDVKDAKPESEILTTVNDRKQLMETIKIIGIRAETSMLNHITPYMSNPEEARSLMRSIYQSTADLKVDIQNKRLYVLLHHSNFAVVDNIIRKLCDTLNATQTIFPGSELALFYKLLSDA